MNSSKYKQVLGLLLGGAAVLALAGCGGGSDAGSVTDEHGPAVTPSGPQLTGKAIDGYLVGASVCLDMNGNNACDTGEPNAVTDDNGNYSLSVSGDMTGKRVLVLATTATKDKSRPGYTFPAGFSLSALVDGTTGQHVTPLTTMVIAQMESGLSQAGAQQAVAALVGGSVNLRDDYIASGDTNAATFASQVVDKVMQFTAGSPGADTVRAVMNAIVAKGSVSAVTQADVAAAGQAPVYAADVDAAALLAQPLYGYDTTVYPATGLPSLVRERWTYAGGRFGAVSEEYTAASGAWSAVPAGKYEENFGQYALLPSGAWSSFISQQAQETPETVTISGNTVTGTDPNTGITDKLEFRRRAVGGQSYADVLGDWLDDDLASQLSGLFAAGSNAYTAIHTSDSDVLTLLSYSQCGTGPTIVEDGVSHCNFLGGPTQTYTAVEDVLDLNIPFGGTNMLQLSANGVAQVRDMATNTVVINSSKISWSKYARNPNVIVLNLTAANIGNAAIRDSDLIREGGKVVVALHNGRLKRGQLVPAGTVSRVTMLQQSPFDAFITAVKAALSL